MATLARNAGGPVHLGDATLRVPLTAADGQALQAKPGHKAVLILAGLSAATQPGITYRVYFGLPDGAAPDETHMVGTLNFYSAVQLDGAKPKPEPFQEFDVTALAADSANLAVILVPEGHTENGSAPVIKNITIVER